MAGYSNGWKMPTQILATVLFPPRIWDELYALAKKQKQTFSEVAVECLLLGWTIEHIKPEGKF